MDLFPSIDLRDGQVVRLARGDYAVQTVYGDDPVAVARDFDAAGARWIHVVDLDAALNGGNPNLSVIEAICANVQARVQTGGGVRSVDDASARFAAGATRVVIGSAAVEHPEIVGELNAYHPGQVAVGLDARGRDVAIHGWTDATGLDLVTLAQTFDEVGVGALIVTDISRDGMLTGPALDQLGAVVAAVGGAGDRERRCRRHRRSAHARRVRSRRQAARGVDRRPGDLRAPLHRRRRDRRVLAVRVIPCLDVDAGRVVKGVNFVGIRDAGDPVELAARYDAEGADELVFLDITASSDARDTMVHVVEQVAETRVHSVHRGRGSAHRRGRAAHAAGRCRQGLVQHRGRQRSRRRARRRARVRRAVHRRRDRRARSRPDGGWEVVTHGGRTPTGLDALAWAEQVCALGAGEILLTSMDRDGTKAGYDIALLRAMGDAVDVPIIASGGVGSLEHLYEGAAEGGAGAVLAASIFHFGQHTVREAKAFLGERGLVVRP